MKLFINRKKIFIFLLLFSVSIYGESLLFESAMSDSGSLFDSALGGDTEGGGIIDSYSISGALKTGAFMDNDFSETKETYFVGDIDLTVDKGDYGKAYADIKFEDLKDNDDVYLREAYIDMYLDKWDFRVGKQIVVWGRADGVNPTDNINPRDMSLYTFDEDESRMANFMLKANYNFYPFTLEFIAVPSYEEGQFPIAYDYTDYEDREAYALKFSYEYSFIDGSFSYYNGYGKQPGLVFADGEIAFKPYKEQVFGWDFATTLGKYGFRNEFAYKYREDEVEAYVPFSELDYIVGIDKNLTEDISLILQYSFKYIIDFEESYGELLKKNYIISSQTKEIQSSVIFRLTWELMHETLSLENLTNYNFDTEELFTRFKGDYDIRDSFTISAGFDLYEGKDDTLFGMTKDFKTAVYAGLKVEF